MPHKKVDKSVEISVYLKVLSLTFLLSFPFVFLWHCVSVLTLMPSEVSPGNKTREEIFFQSVLFFFVMYCIWITQKLTIKLYCPF